MNAMCSRNYNCTIGSIVNKISATKLYSGIAWNYVRRSQCAQSQVELACKFHSFVESSERTLNADQQHERHEMLWRYWMRKRVRERSGEQMRVEKKTANWTKFPDANDVLVSFVWRYRAGGSIRLHFAVFHHWNSVTELVFMWGIEHRLHHIYSIMKNPAWVCVLHVA